MPNAVLIPFDTTNSTEHIQSTAGGYTSDVVDQLSVHVPRDIEDQVDQHIKPMLLLPGWGKVSPDRIVCADSPNRAIVLASLGAGDTLYIRGHCSAGSSQLQSSDHTVNIGVQGIIGLLTGALPVGFAGKLKVYACESGKSSGMLWWAEESFAKKLSDAMILAGWNACAYYGYTEELSTFVVNGHKRVKTDHTRRAQSVRVRVA